MHMSPHSGTLFGITIILQTALITNNKNSKQRKMPSHTNKNDKNSDVEIMPEKEEQERN